MRLLFLLLVLANLAFFAHGQMARERAGAAGRIQALQIHPETIRLVGRGEGASTTIAKATPAPPVASSAPAACLEWGEFAGGEVARADAALARLELPQAQVQRTVTDAGGYWVYIPPLKSKAEVDRRVAELKGLRIPDIFVVQEVGQWRNAISLGIFKTEEGAQKFLDTLRERGVKTAVTARREKLLKKTVYLVHEPGEALVAQLAALQREFPGTQIRAVACPAGTER
jgi:hypothetical protein